MNMPIVHPHVVEIGGNLVCTDQIGCEIVHAFHGWAPIVLTNLNRYFLVSEVLLLGDRLKIIISLNCNECRTFVWHLKVCAYIRLLRRFFSSLKEIRKETMMMKIVV